MLVKIEIYNDGEFWCARALGEGIFTQGDTLDELMKNIQEAASLYFEERLAEGESINLLILSETTLKPRAVKVS